MFSSVLMIICKFSQHKTIMKLLLCARQCARNPETQRQNHHDLMTCTSIRRKARVMLKCRFVQETMGDKREHGKFYWESWESPPREGETWAESWQWVSVSQDGIPIRAVKKAPTLPVSNLRVYRILSHALLDLISQTLYKVRIMIRDIWALRTLNFRWWNSGPERGNNFSEVKELINRSQPWNSTPS